LPRVFKRNISKEISRKETLSVLHICGLRIRILDRELVVGTPHVIVFCPYYENSMVGGNEFGSLLPQVSDDAGTPFPGVVIPIDDWLAVKARAK
jgi:hypothetical protein